ncbi:hypothetical protein HMPREF1870_00330 [Bacteroidales bacterium KA00344]|nr:hypothetical protein HMPREF1870_00330 [Bacteroidales bacterium KA00344]
MKYGMSLAMFGRERNFVLGRSCLRVFGVAYSPLQIDVKMGQQQNKSHLLSVYMGHSSLRFHVNPHWNDDPANDL